MLAHEKYIPLTNNKLFKDTLGARENKKFLEKFFETYFNFPNEYLHNKIKVRYIKYLRPHKRKEDILIILIDNRILVTPEILNIENKNFLEIIIGSIDSLEDIEDSVTGKFYKINEIKNIEFNEKSLNSDALIDSYFIEHNKINNIRIDIINLKVVDTLRFNENNKLITFLKFINAQNEIERYKISKSDELLKKIEEWIINYCDKDEVFKKLIEI